MSKYRPVDISIWEDEDEFLTYSDGQKLLFLYLITNRKTTASGIYKVTTRIDSFILNWDAVRFTETISTLSPNVYYDAETSTIFIKNFLKFNGLKRGRPDLVEKSIASDMDSFGYSPFWQSFVKVYPKFGETYSNSNSYSNSQTKDSDIPLKTTGLRGNCGKCGCLLIYGNCPDCLNHDSLENQKPEPEDA